MSSEQNRFAQKAWEANAALWDQKMGSSGNDFFRVLQFPTILRYLGVEVGGSLQGSTILDIACGNGILSRKLASLGAMVTAFDFSTALIDLARAYQNPEPIDYRVLDATSAEDLAKLPIAAFDHAICNMALFDIADIEPLFGVLPRLLKPNGTFIFSLVHPAFNNSSTVKMMEETDIGGVLKTTSSVKISRYLSIYAEKGLALSEQKHAQYYFNRPIQYYLNLGFASGFVVEGFDETSFPEGDTQRTLSWGTNFAEIPPVLLVKMRLSHA